MEQNASSVWIYSAVPGYRITALDGKNTWYAGVALRVERSTNLDISDNREDPSGQIGWTRELEKGSAGVSASYIRTSTRNKQFRETGLLFEDGTDTTRAISANWKHLFSEQLDLALDGGYEKTTFGLTQGGGDSNVFTDSSTRFLNSTLTYKLSDTYRPYISLGINDFRALKQIKYQNYLAGVIVEATPKFTYDLSVGNTHFSSTGENEWVGGAKANYLGGRYTIDGGLYRSVIATDVGNTELIDLLNLNYSYDLSEKSRWGLGLNLSQVKSDNPNKTQQISAFYARDLSRSWLMNLYLEMRNIKNQGEDSVHGNSAGITFTYNTPKF